MGEDKIDFKNLDNIINNVIDVITQSKNQIFEISENARTEHESLEIEFQDLKKEVGIMIDETKKIEVKLKNYKTKLLEVNKNFDFYSEEEAKRIYDETDSLRVLLIVKREREKYLLVRRTEIEKRLIINRKTILRAEKLMENVAISLKFLSGDLLKITSQLEEIQERQDFGIRIIKAQEEERQKVGREIHDGPAQSMSNIVLKAEICERLMAVDQELAKGEIKILKQLTRNTLQEVRRIIYDLRPMSLDDLGLIPTVTRYISTFLQDTDIEIAFKENGDFSQLQPMVSVTIFRIVQEALSNIKKYSNARNVNIVLRESDQSIKIFIYDNGEGFDMKILEDKKAKIEGGFGIIGMKERVGLLRGNISIKSDIGKGTEISIEIPLNIGGDENE